MPLHFAKAEYTARQAAARAAMQEAGLDAVLVFAPETQYWLCGYDTFGFAMFQCLVLTVRGELHLLTRPPDRLQALHTSTLTSEQIHLWADVEGVNPAAALAALLADLGISGPLGFEGDTAGLTDRNGQALRAALPDLRDVSVLLRDLRRIKSPAEIGMIRRAAALSDDALDAALELARPGAFEGDILAAMQGAVFRGGGDYAGNEFILGSGAGALLCRYYSGRRHLSDGDQLTLEWSGAYARYHAAMMRTLLTGPTRAVHGRMFEAALEALEACEAAILPGAPMGDVFAAHAEVFDRHGLRHARLKACGYGMGIAYNPIWVEFPMFHEGNPLLMQPGQAFFLHMILADDATGAAMCLGHTGLLSERGFERLSRHDPARALDRG